jgi:hypothetical protein
MTSEAPVPRFKRPSLPADTVDRIARRHLAVFVA